MTVRFTFDFISPYAYLASTQIHAVAARHGHEVELRPVLFAAFLNQHGHKGPAEIPPKRVWVFKEVVRRASMLGVPFGPPRSHPFHPLLSLRAVLACEPERRQALCERLWAEAWGGEASGGLDDPATVVRRAAEAGLDGEALVARTRDPSVKAALRSNTEQALAEGCFGVPTMHVGDELFWGFDALDLLDLYLAGKDPLDPALVARWRDLPSSASRT